MEGAVSSKSDDKEESINFEEICLRPLHISDLDDIIVWATDEKVVKFCGWETNPSKEEAMGIIQKVIQSPWGKAICINKHAIGCIAVRFYSDEWRAKTAELGYALGSRYWGKGIATHVVKLVTKTIFSELPQVERLEAVADTENVGSQRVLEKAGFQREGVLRKYAILKGARRDVAMFSFLPTDSQA